MDILKQLLLQLILIALNAFFAATEIALISLNEKKVKAQAEDGNKKAKKMLKIIEEPTAFLSTIQIGITLAGFLGSAFAADNFGEMLSAWLVRIFNASAAMAGVINTISVVLITLILSYFTLILGELVPKRVAMRHKEKLASAVCGIISGLTTVLRPIIWFLSASTNLVLRLFGIQPDDKEEAVSEEDIVIMLDAGADEGTLDEDDIEYIKNVFKLDNLCAADVMTPRNSLVAVPVSISAAELFELVAREEYSRVPVFEGSVDKIIGILHTRDFLLNYTKEGFLLKDHLMEAEFVPETAHLDAVFKSMQKNHNHMAVVLDEYGMTAGILTMEDIIEELVGEIWDEADVEVTPILEQPDGTFKVLTSVSIEEFFAYFDLVRDDNIASTTVNGWLCEANGLIPEEGYTLEFANLSIRVSAANEQKTLEVIVTVHEVSPDGETEE